MKKYFLILFFVSMSVVPLKNFVDLNCAHAQDELDGDLDVGDDLESLDQELDSSELDLDTDEGDLDANLGEEEQPPPPETIAEDIDEGIVAEEPVEEAPFEEQASEPIEEFNEEPSEEFAQTDSEPVTITDVGFNGNQNGGTIVIKATGPLNYTTRTNEGGNQFIIEISNAKLPNRFKRPYNTKEFSSKIGFFQGYQGESATTARFVVQLREPINPNITVEGNQLFVAAEGGGASAPIAEEQIEEIPIEEPPQEIAMESAPQGGNWDDSRALNTRTLDEFLLSSKQFYGHPISVEVKNTDIRDVFNFIAEESGLNLVLSDGIQGKVTLKLREIPWDQALVVLMQSKQLGYVRQGNILRIETLSAIRAETDATRQLLEAQRQLQPMRVQIFPISYARAKDLEPHVKDFLSSRGKVKADARTNSMVVTDIAENIMKVRKLIKSLDTQTPQVLIEGKVVEAREQFDEKFGFVWGIPGVETDVFDWVSRASSPDKVKYTPTAALGNSASGSNTIGISFNTIDVLGNLTATLDMLESEDVVRVVSSPRIVTLNNIEAQIKQTTEVPIFTTSTEDGETETTIEYKELNLQLKVTPQITAEGGIIMQMFIERQFQGEPEFSGDASASSVFGRSAQTTILINNGETAVIGGIYQNDVTEATSGTPFLRNIPIIGSLFRSQSKSIEKNELLIFLTPRVLNREAAFGATTGGGDLIEDFSDASGAASGSGGFDGDTDIEEDFDDNLEEDSLDLDSELDEEL